MPKTLHIASPAFEHGQPIPARFTADGEDVAPAITITGGPPGGLLAIIMDDPDAPVGLWTHWTAWNIPHGHLPEGFDVAAAGGVEGANSWGRTGYGGPAPPAGTGVHRYFFRIYQQDAALDLPPGADRAALDDALAGHSEAAGETMGTYSRDKP